MALNTNENAYPVPQEVVDEIVAAVAGGKELIWVPPAFRYVMMVLRHIPTPIFRKLPI